MGMKEEGWKGGKQNKAEVSDFSAYLNNGYKAVSYIGTQIKYCLLNVDCSCLKAIEISIIFSLIS